MSLYFNSGKGKLRSWTGWMLFRDFVAQQLFGFNDSDEWFGKKYNNALK